MPAQINPSSFTNAFNDERDRGMRNRMYADQQQQQQFQNARVTEADAQTRTTFDQSQTDRADTQKAQSLGRVGAIAQKALTLTDPAQRKGFISQAITTYGKDFAALGSDTSKVNEMLAMPDDQLTGMLQQVAQFAPEAKPIEVAAGGSIVTKQNDGSYKPAFTAPQKPESTPSGIQEYEYAKGQGFKGTFEQYQLQMKRAGAGQVNLPAGYRWGANGAMEFVPGGPADPAKLKTPSEGDKKAAVMFGSMVNAEQMLAAMPKGGTDTASTTQAVLGSNPVTSGLQSDEYRKYESAGLRWAANLLYLKSGATATPDEIRSTWKQFFPQRGDGDDVKAQKAQARGEEMRTVAGTYSLDASKIPQHLSAPPQGAPGAAPQPGGQAAPVRVNSPQEALALAPGTPFMTPDGRVKVRP